jgi:hypothetical protein
VPGNDNENPKIDFIAKSIMKIQNELFQGNKRNKPISIRELIGKMKPEIESQFGD